MINKPKVILHTEASLGFGGQEIRICREAEGMRELGKEVILAAPADAEILSRFKKLGFQTYALPFEKKKLIPTVYNLLKIIKKHNVELVNTHSSNDAWLAGIAAKIARIPVLRTRHLSTAIRPGLNSRILYNFLADQVVTTCEEVVPIIRAQARLADARCQSIPTGVYPEAANVAAEEIFAFRRKYGIEPSDEVVGTLCVFRSWKGLRDLIGAANLLKNRPNLKWLFVGSGPQEDRLKEEVKSLGLENKIIFTGFVEPPFVALAAMDIFALLSTSNEGVSQASLQAAYLKKPLITTTIGGLKEVCIEGETGYLVAKNAPNEVAIAVEKLLNNAPKRENMGKNAHSLILEKFTFKKTINEMERVYSLIHK